MNSYTSRVEEILSGTFSEEPLSRVEALLIALLAGGSVSPGTGYDFTVINNKIRTLENLLDSHTVRKDVPANAVFTDTVYDDTAIASAIDDLENLLKGHTINVDVPANAVFTDTVYDDTVIKARVSTLEGQLENHIVRKDVPSNAVFTDTVYDDTALANRVATLENNYQSAGGYDDTALKNRVSAVENLVDGHSLGKDVPSDAVFTDTIYDDTSVINRIAALEAVPPGTNYDDTEIKNRMTTVEGLLDGHSVEKNVPSDAVFTDTVYDDTGVVNRIAALEAVPPGTSYDDTAIKNRMTTVENLLDGHSVGKDVPTNALFTDTVYDDTALANRVATIENNYASAGGYDDTALKNRVQTVENLLDGHSVETNVPAGAVFTDTVYDDTNLSNRVATIENNYLSVGGYDDTAIKGRMDAVENLLDGHSVETNVPAGAVFTDTVYDDSSVIGRLEALEAVPPGTGYDDTAIKNRMTTVENLLDGHSIGKDVPSNAVFTDTVYDDTALSGRVGTVENLLDGHSVGKDVPANAVFTDTVYDDTSVVNRISTLENAPTATPYDDTALKNRVQTVEGLLDGHSVKTNVPVGAVFTDTVYNDTNLKNRIQTVEGQLGGHILEIDVPSSANFTDTIYDDTALSARVSDVEALLDGHSVEKDVPANAVFTDTLYDDTGLNTRIDDLENDLLAIPNVHTEKIFYTEASERVNIDTGEDIPTIFGKIKKWFSSLKTVAFTNRYTDLDDKPVIPSKTSELENDAGFLTSVQFDSYTGTSPIEVTGTTISHLDSGVTAGDYGPTGDVTGTDGSTIKVPQITVDAKGHVTNVTERTLTNKNEGKTYTGTSPVVVSGTDISHANSGVTAGSYGPTANVTGSNNATVNIPQITVDAKGHVTGITNRVLTNVNTDTNTTYGASAPISLSGTTFGHANSGVTAGTYGPAANVSGTNGTTINVPQITVNATGHVTGVTNRVLTNVNTDTNTTYGAATASAAGLMSAADKAKMDRIGTVLFKDTASSGVAVATGYTTFTNLAGVTLTPGKWIVSGRIGYYGANSTGMRVGAITHSTTGYHYIEVQKPSDTAIQNMNSSMSLCGIVETSVNQNIWVGAMHTGGQNINVFGQIKAVRVA